MTCQWLRNTQSMSQRMITWILTSDFLERIASISWGRASVTLFPVDRNVTRKIWRCTGNNKCFFFCLAFTHNTSKFMSPLIAQAIQSLITMFETSTSMLLPDQIILLPGVDTSPFQIQIWGCSNQFQHFQETCMYKKNWHYNTASCKSNVTIPAYEQSSC